MSRLVYPARTRRSYAVWDVVGDLLGDGESALGVEVQSLGVADEHVHYAVWVADAGDVGFEVLPSAEEITPTSGQSFRTVAWARRC